MLFTIFKISTAACVIAFCSWISGKRPELAGFITALPLVSIIALAFSYIQHNDMGTTTQYARSILLAVPISYVFFIPFFFTKTSGLGFWLTWSIGLGLLICAYFVHQWIMKQM